MQKIGFDNSMWRRGHVLAPIMVSTLAIVLTRCGGDDPASQHDADEDTSPPPGDAAETSTGDDVDASAGDVDTGGADEVAGDVTEQCLARVSAGEDAECRACVCEHCADLALACQDDPACVALALCAMRTGCVLAECAQPDTCQAELDAAGGIASPSVALAIPYGGCALDHTCCGFADEPETCELPAIAPGSADAPPEEAGPYAVERWVDPPGSPVPLVQGIFYPVDAPCPGAPVLVIHGGNGTGCFHLRMAQLLASRGLVAIVPTMPSRNRNPAPEDGELLNALLDWTIAQGDDPATPIAGLVDGSRLGAAGHSNGGIVFYAAAGNPDIAAIVGWDAVAGLDATPGVHGASLHLLADGPRRCGGGSRAGYDGAPEPKAMAIVDSSTHCDFQNPPDGTCVAGCDTDPYDPVAVARIERYSVAWLVCLLGHDPAMGDYVSLDGLEGLSGVEQVGGIDCRPISCE